MRRFACLVVLLLVGCSKANERITAVQSPVAAPAGTGPAAQYAWARSDGQRMAGNPDLIADAQADIAACQAEAPPRAAQGVPGEPCMRERGYYVRPME
jgi:hypothetical protein